MYKIFINSVPVFLNNAEILSLPQQRRDILQVTYKSEQELKDIILYIENNTNTLSEVHIWNQSLKQLESDFLSNYQPITAAGGVVFNADNHLLLIYRKERWDLPKGKVEPQEPIEIAALREVAEETGVSDAIILKPLIISSNKANVTYHTYYDNKRNRIFKTTHWFKMSCTQCNKLQPQHEEGITSVEWVAPETLHKGNYLQNTYASIKDVLSAALLT